MFIVLASDAVDPSNSAIFGNSGAVVFNFSIFSLGKLLSKSFVCDRFFGNSDFEGDSFSGESFLDEFPND
jgi:hypothetical protein